MVTVRDSQEEFVKAISLLSRLYGKEFDNEQASIWYSFFKDDDIDLFKIAIRRMVLKSKYMPTISEIKEEMMNVDDPMLSAEEEYKNLITWIRKGGTYPNGEEYFKTLNPITQRCIETIGKNYLMEASTNEFEFIRKDFIKYFNNYQKRYKEEKLVSLNGTNKTYMQIKDFTKNFLLEDREDE